MTTDLNLIGSKQVHWRNMEIPGAVALDWIVRGI